MSQSCGTHTVHTAETHGGSGVWLECSACGLSCTPAGFVDACGLFTHSAEVPGTRLLTLPYIGE
eukprot:6149144-Prymnesium_polylepis.1